MSNKQTLLSILILLVIPILLGHSFSVVLNKDKSLPFYYVCGYTLQFAFMQFVSVPLVFLMKPYHWVYNVTLVFIIVFSIVGIVIRIVKKDIKISLGSIKVIDVIFMIFTLLLFAYFLYQTYTHQYVDADDSRFLANAVDMLTYDTMYLTNPATGEIIDWFTLREVYKDVVSTWATYIAFIVKFSGINTPIMAHTMLPFGLYTLAIATWYVLAGKLFDNNKMYQCMFVIMVLLMIIYGHYESVDYGLVIAQNVFTKFLTRIWQGKTVVASIGIPVLLVSLFDYYEKNSIKNLFVVFVANMALTFMSGNGIVVGALLIGSFSLAYTISQKKISTGLKLLPIIIPNILYYILSMIVKNYKG